ncbi:MAG: signal peptidase I [Lachnospiraceae bacterium]|nr:signal peptidase I [Lachnospiraceae bacterium]
MEIEKENEVYEGEISVEEENSEQTEEKEEKTSAKRTKGVLRELFSWVMVVVCAFILAFVITRYIIIKAEVPTGSMISTIQIDDRLIGNRLAYLFSNPKRGDIVIFPYPDNEKETYIKRIVGLPGETIEIVEGVLYIDGKVYEEPYLNEPMKKENCGPFLVPEGHYFMMGDNRNHSWDSRYWTNHYVAKDKILGKAWLRYEPSWGLLK